MHMLYSLTAYREELHHAAEPQGATVKLSLTAMDMVLHRECCELVHDLRALKPPNLSKHTVSASPKVQCPDNLRAVLCPQGLVAIIWGRRW